MPNLKSAMKRLRQTKRRTPRNKRWKAAIKASLKRLKGVKNENGRENLQKVIDKATKKGVIHKNKAARLKSRLSGKSSA